MPFFRPSVEQWRSLISELAPDLPTDFVLGAIDEESGGNECSMGITDPSRFEAGIMQTMHPQDNIYGATAEQLRVTCSGQTPIRAMTPTEQRLQAQVAVNALRAFREAARQRLAAVGASWSESSTDFWNFVKLTHGLPAMQTDLMRQVVGILGRAPDSWDEFRQVAMAIPPGSYPQSLIGFALAPSTHGLTNRIEDIFENAEKAGQYGGGVLAALGSPLGKGLLVIAGAATLLAYLIRRRR